MPAHGNLSSEKIKPCQTKVWRSQGVLGKPAELKFGVPRRSQEANHAEQKFGLPKSNMNTYDKVEITHRTYMSRRDDRGIVRLLSDPFRHRGLPSSGTSVWGARSGRARKVPVGVAASGVGVCGSDPFFRPDHHALGFCADLGGPPLRVGDQSSGDETGETLRKVGRLSPLSPRRRVDVCLILSLFEPLRTG